MDPATIALIASLVGGGAEALFGSNSESMTPEQRRALEYVWAELKKGNQGFDPQEKMGMQSQLKTGIEDFTQEQIATGTTSAARRGVYDPGTNAAMTTSAIASGGEAYGKGLTDINIASANVGRQRKSWLEGMLPGLSQGVVDDGGGFGESMADYIRNLTYHYASRKKQPSTQNRSAFNDPNFGYPSPFDPR